MLIERNCRCISGNRLPCGRGTFRLGHGFARSAFTDSAFVCTTLLLNEPHRSCVLGLCASQNVMQFQPPNKIPPLQRAQLCEGGTWYHWQPAAVRRKELPFRPLALRDRLSPMVLLSVPVPSGGRVRLQISLVACLPVRQHAENILRVLFARPDRMLRINTFSIL